MFLRLKVGNCVLDVLQWRSRGCGLVCMLVQAVNDLYLMLLFTVPCIDNTFLSIDKIGKRGATTAREDSKATNKTNANVHAKYTHTHTCIIIHTQQ